MNNSFAIESFIDYCDNMMIVTEAFDVKKLLTSIKEKFVRFFKRAIEFFKRLLKMDKSKDSKCSSEINKCEKTLDKVKDLDKMADEDFKSAVADINKECERVSKEMETMQSEFEKKREEIRKESEKIRKEFDANKSDKMKQFEEATNKRMEEFNRTSHDDMKRQMDRDREEMKKRMDKHESIKKEVMSNTQTSEKKEKIDLNSKIYKIENNYKYFDKNCMNKHPMMIEQMISKPGYKPNWMLVEDLDPERKKANEERRKEQEREDAKRREEYNRLMKIRAEEAKQEQEMKYLRYSVQSMRTDRHLATQALKNFEPGSSGYIAQKKRITEMEQKEKDFIAKHKITNPYNGPAESRYYD